MKKEVLTLFFCDVYGTIDGGFTESECMEFASLLEQIRIIKGSDYLYFGMASTEEQTIVDFYEKRLSKYFTDRILLVPKDDEIEVLREIKNSYTLKHIEKLQVNYDINEVFFADDSKFNHELFEVLLSQKGIKLNSIIPGENQNYLKYINEQLESNYFLENSKSML